MTIPVVQFCFAVSSGDSEGVRRLLPLISEHDLFQGNNYGVSPALFCFLAHSYASQQKPEALYNKLLTVFPKAPKKYRNIQLDPAKVEAASQIAITAIKNKLLEKGSNLPIFLHTLLPHMSHDFDGDFHTKLTLDACMGALREILTEKSLPAHKRLKTESVFTKFSALYQAPTLNHERPGSVSRALQEQARQQALQQTSKAFTLAYSRRRAPICAEEERLDKIIKILPSSPKCC